MGEDTEKEYKFKKQLKELAKFKGSGTQLISVYIPADYPIHETTNKLRNELSQASNIKSKSTKLNVSAALEKIIHHLKMFKKTPPKGLCVFAGDIADNPSKTDVQLYSFEPIFELKMNIYRCDSKFFLEPLQNMMDTKDSYGIVAMDGKDATIAIIKGTETRIIKKLHSTAHSKIRKGGQCIHENDLVVKSDGEITEIKSIREKEKIKVCDFKNNKIVDGICSRVFKRRSEDAYVIQTKRPLNEITATDEHVFFVFEKGQIREKNVEELRKGDKLVISRKVETKGKNNSKCSKELAQLLGYITGDGNIDNNRVCIYESKRELINNYAKIVRKSLKKDPKIRIIDRINKDSSWAKKLYFEMRIYSKDFVEFIKRDFGTIVKKSNQLEVPKLILQSEKEVQAAFLRGLYDAEGYVHDVRVEIAMTSKKIIKQIQIMLSRFGIIASFSSKKVKTKMPQWCVSISDRDSVIKFAKYIGFTLSDKKKKLEKISKRAITSQYCNQIAIDGRQIYLLANELGMKTRDFDGLNTYFQNKRQIGRGMLLRKVIPVFERKLPKSKKALEILRKLADGDIIIAEINKKSKIKSKDRFYDLTIPKYRNFLANGVVVHNSAARYQRLIEESIEKYYKRIGESMDSAFLNRDLKGVIVGGPGPAKDYFMKSNTYNYQLKVLGVVDTGYTDEYGIREVIAKSGNIIEKQELVKEKILVERFIKEVVKGGLATYGLEEVKNAIETKQADHVLISEDIPLKRVKYKCSECGKEENIFIKEDEQVPSKNCEKCSLNMQIEEEEPVTDYFIELAQESKIKVDVVSSGSAEGAQFLQGFGGIGAFLRYR